MSPNTPTSPWRRIRENRFFFPVLLAAFWLCMVAAVGIPNFPLNDAWSYALIPQVLLEEGRLFYPPWVSMALITQVLWGALFCVPFGFSHAALNLSTLALGFAGVLGVYALLRECRADRALAFFGGLVIAANPIFFSLSLTFMTDVPFFSLAVLSAAAFSRGLRTGSSRAVATGICFSCAATLVRDVGLAIPAAFAVVCLFEKKRRAIAFLAILAPLVCHFGFQKWIEMRQALPALYTLPREMLLESFRDAKAPFRIAKWSVVQLVYLGVFLFPFLATRISRIGAHPDGRLRARYTAVSFTWWALVLALAVAFGCRNLMPLATKPGNILRDFGVGPALLSDVYALGLPNLPAAPRWFWISLTVAGVAGAALLLCGIFTVLQSMFAAWKTDGEKISRGMLPGFILLAAAFCFLPFSIAEGFDRYYLLTLPLAMAVVLVAAPPAKTETDNSAGETFASPDMPGRMKRATAFIAVATLLCGALLTLATTREYLGWNRAKWRALENLTGPEAIAPRDIDGGFEFNGLHTYDPEIHPTDPRFWVRNAPWMVTFGQVEGYREWKRYPYRRWMPWKKADILILRREKESS